MHLTSLCRQLLMHLSKTHKLDLEQIVIPSEMSPIHEVFVIPNLTTVLPNEGESTEEYINHFQEGISDKSMLIFTDRSAQGNPSQTGSAAVIKKQGLKSVPIKKVKAIPSRSTTFEGELEAVYTGTGYAKDNLSSSNNNLHIYTDSLTSSNKLYYKAK